MGVNQRAQIVMTPAEVEEFLQGRRKMTVASLGPTGHPHLVAMWYGFVDGAVCFETKSKSQKAVNLRRDPRISCLVEDGEIYEELRGVSLEGTAEVIDDPEFLWKVGVSVFERYVRPYQEEHRPAVELMLRKRVAVKVHVERVRSWDHRRLGMSASSYPTAAGAFDPRRR